jgi:MarR family transcriptional regulator, organic hydroperoxide resistance regulator
VGLGTFIVGPLMKNSFSLAEFVPYLLNRAGVRIGLAFARDIEPLGVSLPMWRVMAALYESGDQRLGDIAEHTSIDISTLSRLLVTLQRKQFVVRRRSGTDGRALSVSLTDKGRAMTEKIIPIASHYEDVAIRGINSGELRQLKRMLVTLFSNIKTIEQEVEAKAEAERRKKARRG